MPSMEEYRAVHGKEPANRKDTETEFGDGGCNVISQVTGGIIGRWDSWDTASRALSELQKLGFGYEYRLEESHQWAQETESKNRCPVCRNTRGVPALSSAGTGILRP